MADIDIKRLRTTELKSFSLEESLKVVSQIEAAILSEFDAVNTTEEFGEYYSYINIIDTRLATGEFEKISKAKESDVKDRLNNIKFNLSVLLRVNNIAEDQWRSNIRRLNTFRNDVENTFNLTQDKILKRVDQEKQEVLDAVAEVVNKEKDEINKVEHTTVTHALTLMGVFSAIITIIMSVVITATSWLNNADGASAIVGFAIPNLVVLLSISTLLALIYLLFNRDHLIEAKSKPGLKCWVARIIVVFALIVSVLITSVLLAEINKNSTPHIRYIISPEDYTIVESENANGEIVLHYVFSFDNQNFMFECCDDYNHNGSLYFCQEHNTLE